jgi:hypothetical protein
MNGELPIIGQQKREVDYTLEYSAQKVEEMTFYELTAHRPNQDSVIVGQVFEENAAITLKARYNLHETLMQICLLAMEVRKRQKLYFQQRNAVAYRAANEAAHALDNALQHIQTL